MGTCTLGDGLAWTRDIDDIYWIPSDQLISEHPLGLRNLTKPSRSLDRTSAGRPTRSARWTYLNAAAGRARRGSAAQRLPDPNGRCADGIIHETHGLGAGFRHKAGR